MVQTTTKLQVSGHRFLLRRSEHALVRGDTRMLDDPLRAQSLSMVAGCVLTVIAVAACAILAYLQPRGTLGSAPIVMVRESGVLHVRIGDTWHPALNLASARLVTGIPADPEIVSASAVSHVKRGPLVGIPGAPESIPAALDSAAWTVCDDAAGATTVLVGDVADQLDRQRNALVSVRGGDAATTYLLYDGRRARVDLRNHAVVRALRLDGVAPRPVSGVLLDALPEAPEIVAPFIPAAGAPSMMHGVPVGSVVRTSRAGSAAYFAVLNAGVQQIGEVAADLIRLTQSHGPRDIVDVAPGDLGNTPIVDDLPITTFPDHGGVTDNQVLCARWTSSETAVLVGRSLPSVSGSAQLRLAQADDAGAHVDNVQVADGAGAYVRAIGLDGEGGASGPLYLFTDSGVVFGVHDEDAARRLGLPDSAAPAPWPVLAQLPRGPELSVQGASIVRDSVNPPS